VEFGKLRKHVACQGIFKGVGLDEHEGLFKVFVEHCGSFQRHAAFWKKSKGEKYVMARSFPITSLKMQNFREFHFDR
jgi:hypothetical protein